MINIPLMSNWLNTQADKYGNLTAVIEGKSVYSYSDLHDKAVNLSAGLQAAGINAGDRITIALNNDSGFIISLFAAWNLGATVVPIDPGDTINEIESRFEFTDSKILLTSSKLETILSSDVKRKRHLFVEDLLDHQNEKNLPANNALYNDPALIMFTSGSGGKLKAAVISFKNLYSSCKYIDSVLEFNSGEKWLASLPFYHIGGLQLILRSILSGGTLIVPDHINSEKIFNEYEKKSPCYISVVNATLQKLLQHYPEPYKELKAIFAGGGPIDPELLLSAAGRGFPVYKVYGSTETSSMVTLLTPDETENKIHSAGRPLGNNSIRIVNGDMRPLPSNKSGEIAVKGESVITEYYNDEPLNKSKFIGDYFLTGDEGFLDEDGYLFVTGRKDNFIITGGEKIDPAEIEKVLQKMYSFKDVAVFGMPDEKWGEIVFAAIASDAEILVEPDQIRKELRSKIAPYKIPKKIILLDELPKTELGKIDKIKLKELAG